MATFTIPRLLPLYGSRLRLPLVRLPVPTAPKITTLFPVVKALAPAPAVVKPPTVALTPYLPTLQPKIAPVIYPTLTGPVSPAPVVAPEPAPLVPHTFATCATCGEEKVTAIQPTPAAEVTAAAPTPAAPAPTPAPATPTAEPKPKGGRGWLLAFGIVLALSAGLALASAVRPRK